VLDRIVKDGFKLAIATTKPSHIANLVVNNSSLARFGFYVQGTDDFLPKPNPDVILKCLRYYDDHEAIMVGDRVEDILAAKGAGIPSIGLASSGHSIKDLGDAGAHRVFKSMNEFSEEIAFLENLEDFFGLGMS
jgi:phosphoglycolate phosphatase